MKVQAKGAPATVYLDDGDAGEGLSIFLSQDLESVTRWHFEVYAKLDNSSELFVGDFLTTPPDGTTPAGRPTRMVAFAVCPGAVNWSVIVYPEAGSEAAEPEVCNVTLASSKCCTAPAGVTRVGERYSYRSGDTASGSSGLTFTVLPGRVITSIGVIGKAPGGTVQLGIGNDVITVPTGMTLNLEPQAPMGPGTVISFTDALWTIEYKDSA